MADLDLPRKRQRDGPVIESSMGTVGLQSAQTFKADLDVKRRREEEKMANVDATLQGQGAATVFRDKSGRKVDMVGELLKKSEDREARAAAEAEARYDWGTGLADKAAAATAAEEERKAASAPFARYVLCPG
jgi:pre-mRNA-splicing factor CWC26